LPFDPFKIDLPITEVIDAVKLHLQNESTLIVNAPPGAGKSTLLPLALLDEKWIGVRKIIMLEPRRLAARSIAQRMSALIEEQVGNTIGYRVRFDTKVSGNTKIEVVTEGILTRMLQSDNELKDVALVIFDEFHERSIHADVALALCREAQQVLRPDLKIMVMSATLDMPQLEMLLQAKSIISKGRQYPVEVHYQGDIDLMMLPELTARAIIQATKKHKGDVLAFFPGEGEIRKCEAILKQQLSSFSIHPLYGQLPFKAQQAAIYPSQSGKRKVVLATSIAETSLTIEGITIVVDTGYGRTSEFDPKSGLSRLATIQITKDAADQRAGRAGRLSPGVCYRLWSLPTHERLEEHRIPEIAKADLTSLMLDMSKWGVTNIESLSWMTKPPAHAVYKAKESLNDLGAIESGKITEHGKEMHKLPCHPRIAHMLIEANKFELVELACDIAALIEERDPLGREEGTDINTRIDQLRKLRREDRLNHQFSRIEKVSESYRRLFEVDADDTIVDPYETGLVLTFAYPERIACARPGNNAQFQLANGRIAIIGHKDDLAAEPWLAVANLDARDGMGKIFLASPLNPKDLAPLVKDLEITRWDTKKGGLIASKELRIGNIILRSQPLPNPDPTKITEALVEVIAKEGLHLLNFDEDFLQWQQRVLSVKKWNPSQDWPDLHIDTLLETNSLWLAPYLTNVSRNEDLKKLNLREILNSQLSYDQQLLLDKLAPRKLKVPSGSEIKLEYFVDSKPPSLSVRLQEVFGMLETPLINDGTVKVTMQLLSPGFKPVQITSDLGSFWTNGYFEVRKELKRRYPKHEWPEKPLEAEAISGVRRKSF
jgi:ATP-dependent helicase HrpB